MRRRIGQGSRKRHLRLLTVAMMTGAGCAQAVAQTKDGRVAQAEMPSPAAWTVNCTDNGTLQELTCTIRQVLIARNTGQRVLTAVIARDRTKERYVARLSLPHGLMLPEGVQLWIDEGERAKYAITTADRNGAHVDLTFSEAMTEAMKKGSIFNVLVKAASGDEVILQLSLSGFSAALARL